jgi:hypothetical protein
MSPRRAAAPVTQQDLISQINVAVAEVAEAAGTEITADDELDEVLSVLDEAIGQLAAVVDELIFMRAAEADADDDS